MIIPFYFRSSELQLHFKMAGEITALLFSVFILLSVHYVVNNRNVYDFFVRFLEIVTAFTELFYDRK